MGPVAIELNARSLVLCIVIGSIVAAVESRRSALIAQGNAAAPSWTGSVRCTIDITGLGYINRQTHTWTLTGAAPPGGGVLDYPATWSVSGEGALLPTPADNSSATWKTQGSAPGVRMAIFVRGADQKLVVILRHAQLTIPNATIGVRLAPRPVPIAMAVPEWRPFPTIVDAAASTHITGTTVTPAIDRLDAMQPAGLKGQATCTWDLVQGVAPTVSSNAAPAGAASATARGAGAGAAGAAPPAAAGRATPSTSGSAATGLPMTGGATSGPSAAASVVSENLPNVCSGASERVVNLARGQNTVVTGAIEAAVALDWITVRFSTGTSLHLTLSSVVAGGSEFQVRAYADCATPLGAATSGSGTKTLDFPDSGPHAIVLRVHARPWDDTRRIYTIALEGH